MKYQNFAIIFVIILLPISMVLSYYIQTQTDTLTLQTSYQTKLNDSTYDAIAAYQINSLNTQRISGESVKSYVLASVNTFFTTLATNMGMSSASKQNLLPYVPAILFTTYDGYYIYSPLKISEVVEDPRTGIGLTTKEGNVIYYRRGETTTAADIQNLINTQPRNVNLSSGKFTINPDEAKVKYNYMLKPFIYYSSEYRSSDNGNTYNFVASYTLDNYLTLYGTRDYTKSGFNIDNGIAGITNDFSKSGYLINPNYIELSGNLLIKEVSRNGTQSNSEPSVEGDNTYGAVISANSNPAAVTHNHVRYEAVNITSQAAYNYINYYYYGLDNLGNTTYNTNGYYPSRVTVETQTNPIRYQTGDEIIKTTLDIEELKNGGLTSEVDNYLVMPGRNFNGISVKYRGIEITDRDAKEYYIKSYFFSKWVQNNLKEVKINSINQKIDTNSFEYIDFSNDDRKLFEITVENDPENIDSLFGNHKRDVIKNSIQFNLNTAISTYDATYFGNETGTEFRMPILSNDDWENILNNVSMTSFLQGVPCGTTTFNNYAVVKSNNNNTSVSLENLYFTGQIGTDTQSSDYYHKYDCSLLNKNSSGSDIYPDNGNGYDSDLSAEFKYDAKRINLKVESTSNSDTVICFYDDSSNTYYRIDENKINNSGILSIGTKINNITSYNGPKYERDGAGIWRATGTVNKDLTSLPNGSDVQYLYDHQNLGCYDCIISGIYEPVVKYYNGELRRLFKTDSGELLIYLGSNTYVYENGIRFNGTPTGSFLIGNPNYITGVDNDPELLRRKKAVYTAIAKYRKSLYKANDYVNR